MPGTGQRQVLENGQEGSNRHGEGIFRDESHSAPPYFLDGAVGDILTKQQFPTSFAADHSEYDFAEFLLPIPGDTCHSDDLTGMH